MNDSVKIISAFLILSFCNLIAEGSLITGKLNDKILSTGSNRVIILSPKGEIEWEYKADNIHDTMITKDGNILFADGNVYEVSQKDKKIIWKYEPENQTGGGAYSAQRLPNGNTVIGENSTARILEIDKKGKIIFELKLPSETNNAHHRLRLVRKLKNGNYLACHSGENMVREYTKKGEKVWEKKTKNLAFMAQRTPKNTTLIASLGQITEYDKDGNEIWEFKNNDIEGTKITNMTGFQILNNGNLVIGCYDAYQNGEGCGIIEITKDKKLVWKYSNPKADKNNMGVQKIISVKKAKKK